MDAERFRLFIQRGVSGRDQSVCYAQLGLFGVDQMTTLSRSSVGRSRGACLGLGGCYHADAHSVPEVFYAFTRSKFPPLPKLGIAANRTVMVVTKKRISCKTEDLNNGKFYGPVAR